MELDRHIEEFAKAVGSGSVEVYNEFSLQHELGLYLRNHLPNCKVQFERNVAYFNLNKSAFEKKEIDIAITSKDGAERIGAIELKYPRNGQVPESLFSFCKDIAFLEQLVTGGFQAAYFLALADHPHFYSGNPTGIYGHFRAGVPITGRITKPTGAKNHQVTIIGSYVASWLPVSGDTKFCLVRVVANNSFNQMPLRGTT
jgi:hypothetical protein